MSTSLQSVFAWTLSSDAETDSATLIPDRQFGHCVKLARGKRFTIPTLPDKAKSLSVWVKRLTMTATVSVDLSPGWTVHTSGDVVFNGERTGYVMAAHQWHHVCQVTQGQRITLYINGECVAEHTIDNPFELHTLAYISNGDICLAHQHLMLHELSATGVTEDYKGVLPTIKQSFTDVHPINIAIVCPADGPFADYQDDHLIMRDAVENDVIQQHFVVSNTSDEPVMIHGISQDEVSAEHHHFELRFSDGVVDQIQESLRFSSVSGWRISTPEQNRDDNSWSIFFLSTANCSIAPLEQLDFPFSYRTADHNMDERGAQINLSYRQLKQRDNQSIQGDRHKQIGVLNLIVDSDEAIAGDTLQHVAAHLPEALEQQISAGDAVVNDIDAAVNHIDAAVNDIDAGEDDNHTAVQSTKTLMTYVGDVSNQLVGWLRQWLPGSK